MSSVRVFASLLESGFSLAALGLSLRLRRAADVCDSCRCAFTSMYVPITLKRKSGKVVKSWHLDGADRIEEVLQFIWRDLFLSMLATGSQRQIQMIPDMLDDIEDLLGWTALERLLYGGRKCELFIIDAILPYHS